MTDNPLAETKLDPLPEPSLPAAEPLFRAFIENSPTASCIHNQQGRILFCNTRYAEVFGTAPQTIPPTSADTFETTEAIRHPDGRLTHWRSFRFPCQDTDGQTLLGCVSIDVTGELERAAELARYQAQLEAANDRLRKLAVTDDLTGLRNRRAFDERLAIEFSMARRKGRDLTVVLVDADNFKRVNDQLGHAAGDSVLQQLARVLQDTVRLTDLATRFGGEEFAIILPENDERGGLLWCHRLQKALADTPWEHYPITVSMGVASLVPACVDPSHLVAMADQALYRAKRQGKNCCVSYNKHPATLPT